jgi:hypothetical protein
MAVKPFALNLNYDWSVTDAGPTGIQPNRTFRGTKLSWNKEVRD